MTQLEMIQWPEPSHPQNGMARLSRLANLPGLVQGSYDAVQDLKHPDRARKEGEPPDCWTTNPCMKVMYENIPEGVLVGPPASASFPQLFKRDTELMARAQNIATACSTFSLLGRLTAAHLKRLFVPQCQTKYALSEKQQQEGRRRDTRTHLVVDDRFYWFHQGYAWLPIGVQPAAGQPFSADESRQVSFYENIFMGHAVMVAAVGGGVVALEEWSNLTRNGTNQRPLDSLLRQVAVNKTTFNQRAHAWEVIPTADVQQPAIASPLASPSQSPLTPLTALPIGNSEVIATASLTQRPSTPSTAPPTPSNTVTSISYANFSETEGTGPIIEVKATKGALLLLTGLALLSLCCGFSLGRSSASYRARDEYYAVSTNDELNGAA